MYIILSDHKRYYGHLEFNNSEFTVHDINGGSRMGHLGQIPPLKKLHTRSRYSNREVNYPNKAVTIFMRQYSLPMKL